MNQAMQGLSDDGQAKKPKRGRPRKQVGDLKFKYFRRAAIDMCAYDEVREDDQKHSEALKEAVALGNQRHSEMRTSESQLRRDLATFRPRKNRITLVCDRSIMTESERERLRRMLEQVPLDQDEQCAKALPPERRLPMPRVKYKFRFAERPNYPRYNRKEVKTEPPAKISD